MALATGVRFGPYEILMLLGAGGMGEVYRARDTRLGREVALKILPDVFAGDAERLARFEREAKLLASLNHPNIAIIHGLEHTDGRRALVMELVAGEDLSQRIARGPIPFDEALSIAQQIAEALEAAHEVGIIHRDLKPANVKVRPDGTVKVLDFGLAKATTPDPSDPNLTVSPTLSIAAGTMMGTVLGTAAYMSPEQAKGKPVDRRADIWAFAAVLYEMLAGKPAFGGDDMSDTLVAVLRDDPDWSALPADVPASARQVLRVCLQKDLKRRVRDMSAVRLALDGAFDTPASAPASASAVPATQPIWRRTLPWLAAALAIVAAIAAVVSVSRRPATLPRVARFVITTPPDLPFQRGGPRAIATSPDGSRLLYRLYRGVPQEGAGTLYLREMSQVNGSPIAGTEGAELASFSPDGTELVFGATNTLKRISVSGGPAETICPVQGGLLTGLSWGPDGAIVFSTDASKGLLRVPATGGEPQALTTVGAGEESHSDAQVLPDGKSVIFTAWGGTVERSRILAVSLASGKITELVRGGTDPRFSPTGHLVYAVNGVLRAVPFDQDRLAIRGTPVTVLQELANVGRGANYDLARDGSLLYVKGAMDQIGQRALVWVDRQGHEELINVEPHAYAYARLSPDNTRVALDARDQQNDIWIWDFARESLQRLTSNAGRGRGPVWTPDGTRLAFNVAREGELGSIYWQNADGSGVAERLISVSSGSPGFFPSSFSPDGKQLLMHPSAVPRSISMLRLDGERRETPLIKSRFNAMNGEISPDGRWLAYQSDESGHNEIYLVPYPDVNSSKRQVSNRGGTRPLWSKDGGELFYYVEPSTIMAVAFKGSSASLETPTVAVKGKYSDVRMNGRHYDVSRDRKRFLVFKDVETRKLPPLEIHLVQNWSEELKRLVPSK